MCDQLGTHIHHKNQTILGLKHHDGTPAVNQKVDKNQTILGLKHYKKRRKK